MDSATIDGRLAVARHQLTSKNLDDLTAFCSVCGVVEIRSAGKSFICLNKKKETAAAWRAANPEKTAAGRSTVSAHALIASDPEVRRGICPLDGDVDIVPFGRGWACAVRAAELRSVVQEPPVRCEVCRHPTSAKNPVVDRRCQFHQRHAVRPVDDDYLDPIYNNMPTINLPKYEEKAARVKDAPAVAGWKTIGQEVDPSEWDKWNALLAAEGL